MVEKYRDYIENISKKTGFIQSTLEKVERLLNILEWINNHERLSKLLALKGGTAINTAVFNFPRLSVDIDLDLTENLSKEEMIKERETIHNLLVNSLNSNIKKYAIYGNNDNDNLKLILENTNFLILDNQEDIIYNGENESIKIIGFNAKKLDFSNITESNDYTICLLSNPDKITKVNNTCQVVFSGETLGGEIKLPFTKGLDNHTYYKNYYLINQTKLYINNGLGNNYNLRLFNHPSINFYRLTNY